MPDDFRQQCADLLQKLFHEADNTVREDRYEKGYYAGKANAFWVAASIVRTFDPAKIQLPEALARVSPDAVRGAPK